MEFLHISDLHYRREYPFAKEGYRSIFREMTSPLVHLREGLKKIDLQKLRFILISGDLTEDGEREDYLELKKELDRLFGSVPYIVTAGNHDRQEALYQVWNGGLTEKNRTGTCRRFGNLVVIALNNASEKAPDGIISEEHCRWLKVCLREEEDRGNRVILMMHHPVAKDQMSGMPLVNCAKEFEQIIRMHRPAAILCGHTHHVFQGLYQDVFYATAGSMSFIGDPRADGQVCFREYASMNLCRMEDKTMEVREIPIRPDGRVLGNIRMGDG